MNMRSTGVCARGTKSGTQMRAVVVATVCALFVSSASYAKWERVPVQVKRPAKYELKGITRVAIVPRDRRSGRFDSHVAEALVEKLGQSAGSRMVVIDRATTSKVLDEQKLAVMGLVEDDAVGALGKLLNADALILATADNTTEVKDRKETETVTKYRAKDGTKYEAVCPAVVRGAHLSAVMKVVEVSSGAILVTEQQEFDDELRHFTDPNPADSYIPPNTSPLLRAIHPNPFSRSQDLLDGDIMIRRLAEQAAEAFARLLVPYTETIVIQWDTVIEEPGIYNSVKAGLVTDAMEQLEAKVPALEQDPKFLKDSHRMAALYYNVGALHEIDRDYDGAMSWYRKALVADKSPDKVLIESIKRTRQLMADRVRLQNQGTE